MQTSLHFKLVDVDRRLTAEEDVMSEAVSRFEAPTATEGRFAAQAGGKAIAGAPVMPERNLAMGYLKAFVTLLVVAHHTAIAYTPGLPKAGPAFDKAPMLWSVFPIEDAGHAFAPFGVFVSVNDVFFMSLMFFISGLFVWDSLKRKGAAGFVRDRLLRLGLPFAVAASVLAPLAYYPAYLQTGANPDIGAYWRAWTRLGDAWPAGPAWFIWVLLAYGLAAAGLYRLAPRWGETVARLAEAADRRPLRVFALLVAASGVAFTSMALAFTPVQWFSFGPFAVQSARVLHYAVYFTAGIGVGAAGLRGGLLAPGGRLARRWWVWASLAAPSFVLAAAIAIASYVLKAGAAPAWRIAGDLAWVLSCATFCFAFLASAARFVRKPSKVWDSLSANAYGIYLVHYVFVIWLQYALLPVGLPGVVKGLVVFAAAASLSWATAAALRRAPGLGRVL
jgi:peptidoglycan/LPS O-acetylase OafA/YrhL